MCLCGHASSTLGVVGSGRRFSWCNRCKYLSEGLDVAKPSVELTLNFFYVQLEQPAPELLVKGVAMDVISSLKVGTTDMSLSGWCGILWVRA